LREWDDCKKKKEDLSFLPFGERGGKGKKEKEKGGERSIIFLRLFREEIRRIQAFQKKERKEERDKKREGAASSLSISERGRGKKKDPFSIPEIRRKKKSFQKGGRAVATRCRP